MKKKERKRFLCIQIEDWVGFHWDEHFFNDTDNANELYLSRVVKRRPDRNYSVVRAHLFQDSVKLE